MNVENILKVADAIEQHSIPDLGFNMSVWKEAASPWRRDMSGHNCRTVACIAGWTVALFPDDDAADALGMDDDRADLLFYPRGWINGSAFPSSRAVAVLRHLAATGEVDWSITLSTEGGEQK